MRSTASHFCHPNPSIRVVWIAKSDAAYAKDGAANAASVYGLAKEFARRKCEQLDEAHQHTLPNSNPVGVQHVFVDMAMPESSAQRFMRVLMPGAGTGPGRESCTLLYAGLAPDVRSGDYIIRWGRKSPVPDSIVERAIVEENETSIVGSFGWCEKHTERHTGNNTTNIEQHHDR